MTSVETASPSPLAAAASSLRLTAMTLATFALAVPAIVVSLFDRGGRASSAIIGLWARTILGLAGVRVEVQGRENLPAEGPHVYVSSHQSMLDIPALFTVVPLRTRFVAKRELFRIPLFGQAIRLLGFVPVARDDTRAAVKALDAASDLARASRPVLVFPEGTRSVDGALLPFKKGAFALAHRLRLSVVPMACLGGALCMPAHRFTVRPGRMVVCVGRVLSPDDPAHATRTRLMEAVRAEISGLCFEAARAALASHAAGPPAPRG